MSSPKIIIFFPTGIFLALLASVASGQKMLYINSGDELQKVQCFDDVSALIGESTVKIEECGTEKNKTPCPELQITDDGFLLFRGWSAGHTRTEITCRKVRDNDC